MKCKCGQETRDYKKTCIECGKANAASQAKRRNRLLSNHLCPKCKSPTDGYTCNDCKAKDRVSANLKNAVKRFSKALDEKGVPLC